MPLVPRKRLGRRERGKTRSQDIGLAVLVVAVALADLLQRPDGSRSIS